MGCVMVENCPMRKTSGATQTQTPLNKHDNKHDNKHNNTKQLRKALEELLARPGAVRPEKARFFRGQMTTIITKALGDVGIKALPSRRCFSIMGASFVLGGGGRMLFGGGGDDGRAADALAPTQPNLQSKRNAPPQRLFASNNPITPIPPLYILNKRHVALLEERLDKVYKADPRYSDKAATLFSLDLGVPEPLPDALRGERWAFVQLPLGPLLDMLKAVDAGDMFGAAMDLESAGLKDLPRDILVPGVAVFSRRATPLAAWTNGLEIAAVKADVDRSCLILETGVNQRWRYGGWRASPDSIEEAQGWEEAKEGTRGLHFLAVQPDPDSEDLTGLWLLQDRMPPNV